MKYFITLLSLFLFFPLAHSQYAIGLVPRVSPDKSISQKIGFLEVEIKYGSPKVKGRSIWGELVAWETVWRAGANNATTIHFSQDVLIGEETLMAGTYAFFVVPYQEKAWTIIFSKKAKQWGSFSYEESDDALRLELWPQKTNMHEELDYRIVQKDRSSGVILLEWEKTSLEIPFSVDYIDLFVRQVNTMADERKGPVERSVVLLQGAEYLVEQKEQNEVAIEWLEKSKTLLEEYEGEWNKQYYPRNYIQGHQQWIAACVAAQAGDLTTAINIVETLKKEVNKYTYYGKKKKKVDARLAEWTQQ